MKVKDLIEVLNAQDPELHIVVNIRDRIFNLDKISKTNINDWYERYSIDRSVPSEENTSFLEILALGQNNLGLPRVPRRESEDKAT